MATVLMIVVVTTVVLAFAIDPEVRRCEYCKGPITLREFWSHIRRCKPTKPH